MHAIKFSRLTLITALSIALPAISLAQESAGTSGRTGETCPRAAGNSRG